jgi:hypothetical protein
VIKAAAEATSSQLSPPTVRRTRSPLAAENSMRAVLAVSSDVTVTEKQLLVIQRGPSSARGVRARTRPMNAVASGHCDGAL